MQLRMQKHFLRKSLCASAPQRRDLMCNVLGGLVDGGFDFDGLLNFGLTLDLSSDQTWTVLLKRQLPGKQEQVLLYRQFPSIMEQWLLYR